MIKNLLGVIKVLLLAVIEGVSEWLPISSTGHMLLVEQFLHLDFSSEFKEVFFVLIQLGAILAVIVLFWKKINPFKLEKANKKIKINQEIIGMWLKVFLACIPGALITLLCDEYVEEHLHTPFIISLMLIVYGIAFIVIERINIKSKSDSKVIGFKEALLIGVFQVLSIIPGTSRSGATILGALILGINREKASEFSFFLAIPVMFGWSIFKLIKIGISFSLSEYLLLAIGVLGAFLVSLLVIEWLMNYLKKHSFKIFGIYRIVLGLLVIFLFCNL